MHPNISMPRSEEPEETTDSRELEPENFILQGL